MSQRDIDLLKKNEAFLNSNYLNHYSELIKILTWGNYKSHINLKN